MHIISGPIWGRNVSPSLPTGHQPFEKGADGTTWIWVNYDDRALRYIIGVMVYVWPFQVREWSFFIWVYAWVYPRNGICTYSSLSVVFHMINQLGF
jgi:hypothetical protein